MKHLLLDTNVLLRFLTDDHVQHSPRARALVAKAADGVVVLELLPFIIAETVFTLSSYYKKGNAEISKALLSLIESPGIKTHEQARMMDALRRFSSSPIDFADAYLAAAATDLKLPVASFDKDLDRFKDVSRQEPGSERFS